ncbi:MAG: TetR/AcrR family transcriptional regulator [Acutalibacteraceae bacterium]
MHNNVYHKPTFDNIPEEKRKKILDVAVNEFANNGFENANINTIAKKADVSVGSLYKYFDTKADLFLTSVDYGVSSLEKILAQVVSLEEDVMVKLEKLVRAAISYSRENAVMIKLYNEFTTESNSDLGEKLAERMESITSDAYRKAIIKGQIDGEIRTDIDPGMAALMVDNMLMNLQFSYACTYYGRRLSIYAGKDIFEKDDFVVENVLRFIKSALKPNIYPERNVNI